MSILETFLVVYSVFVTGILLLAFLSMRNMVRTIAFWKSQYAYAYKALFEMMYLATQYREAYQEDVVEKETDDATRR